jgi:predicted kinase
MRDYNERRVDYAAGRETSAEMVVMVGVSGSGKSVLSKAWVNEGRGQVVRVNRDNLRSMLYVDVPWRNDLEDLVRNIQKDAVEQILRLGKTAIIDDTNCVRRTRQRWEELAKEHRVKFREVVMTTPKDVCIERDSKRQGKECVGAAVIEKQFKDLNQFAMKQEIKVETFCRPVWDRELLNKGGFVRRLPNRPFVLCDIDGTLADHTGVRSPFDEKKVLLDKTHPVVIEWLRELYKDYNVIIVSGRHDTCGTDTCDWLDAERAPFDYILMRRGGDNRKDFIIKKEILDEIVAAVGKENIAFVLDDRPQVVKMWREEGLRVFPVAGTPDHTERCTFLQTSPKKGWRKCPSCWALETF